MPPHYYDKTEEEEVRGGMVAAAVAAVCFAIVLGAGLMILGAWALGKL